MNIKEMIRELEDGTQVLPIELAEEYTQHAIRQAESEYLTIEQERDAMNRLSEAMEELKSVNSEMTRLSNQRVAEKLFNGDVYADISEVAHLLNFDLDSEDFEQQAKDVRQLTVKEFADASAGFGSTKKAQPRNTEPSGQGMLQRVRRLVSGSPLLGGGKNK